MDNARRADRRRVHGGRVNENPVGPGSLLLAAPQASRTSQLCHQRAIQVDVPARSRQRVRSRSPIGRDHESQSRELESPNARPVGSLPAVAHPAADETLARSLRGHVTPLVGHRNSIRAEQRDRLAPDARRSDAIRLMRWQPRRAETTHLRDGQMYALSMKPPKAQG